MRVLMVAAALAGCMERADVPAGPRSFALRAPIPLGPVTLTVSDARTATRGEFRVFEVAFDGGGHDFPPDNEWMVVLIHSSGIETIDQAVRFMEVFRNRFALVDKAGRRSPPVSFMTAHTYKVLLSTDPDNVEAKLRALGWRNVYGRTLPAQVNHLEGLRQWVEGEPVWTKDLYDQVCAGGPCRPDRKELLAEGRIPQAWIVMFNVPHDTRGSTLFIENPELRDGQTRLAAVKLVE